MKPNWIFSSMLLLLGLLMGLGLKVHVGHVLGLEHDLGLGVDPSYKPCWDHITRLTLNEFQASYYSHHRSQSTLSETNYLLKASGCNLSLNPYQVIKMGHHHGHLLTGAMELRPDH